MNEPEIGQDISLEKNQDKNTVTITDVNENMHQIGGTYPKHKIEAQSEMGREMKIVLKDVNETIDERYFFPGETKNMSSAERYYYKWNLLRQKGIPTVGSMRIVDSGTVAMGDMTADGSQFFGKEIVSRSFESEYQKKRPLSKTEEKYLEINPREIKDKLDNLFMDAWRKGVILPEDDYYDLLVHPDGTWQVMILDLSNLRPKRDTDLLENYEEMRRDMSTDVDYIRKHLLRIKA